MSNTNGEQIQNCRNCGASLSEEKFCLDCFEPLFAIDDRESLANFSRYLSEIANQMLISDPRLVRVRKLQQQFSSTRHSNQSISNESSHKAAVASVALFTVFEVILLAVSRQLSGGTVVQGAWIIAALCLVGFFLIFIQIWVRCPSCKKYSYRRMAYLDEDIIDESHGWHTENQEISTVTTHRDSHGRQSGFSDSISFVPTRVAHIDSIINTTYCCAHCNKNWDRLFTKRKNL